MVRYRLKKYVVLQVNDAAVRIRLVVIVSKVQLFYIQITEQTGGGRGESRGVPPSVADPGCLYRIPDPDFYPSRISDPGSKNST